MSLVVLAAFALATLGAEDWVVYEGTSGPGKGWHIVLLAGDEEYRSEEALPQLAKILAYRHGFKCTVLFSIGEKGFIDPNTQTNQPGMEALDDADLCVMMLRFRRWPAEQMRHFADYYKRGGPIIALRTSTHAFAYESGPFARFGWQSTEEWPGGFGERALGETWVSHWGAHGEQATRGVIERAAKDHPILNGVTDVFGTTDVYEAHPPPEAKVLLRGMVLDGMSPGSPPASNWKSTSLGRLQAVNEPIMPIAWLLEPLNGSRVFTCTMGSATDLLSEGLRRMLVNASYWLLDIEVPERAVVEIVAPYEPSPFGFDGFRRGIRPSALMRR